MQQTLLILALSLCCQPVWSKPAPIPRFQLHFKVIAHYEHTSEVLNPGLVPPDGTRLYWLVVEAFKEHVYTYDLRSGAVQERPLIPEGELPQVIRWSPDGGQIALVDDSIFRIVSTSTGAARTVPTPLLTVDGGDLFWMDKRSLVGTCKHAEHLPPVLCTVDSDSGAIQSLLDPDPGYLSLYDYQPGSGQVLYGRTASSLGRLQRLYTARLSGGQLSEPAPVAFPDVLIADSDQPVSLAAGRYAVLAADRHNASGSALYAGDIRTGHWVRVTGLPKGRIWAVLLTPDTRRLVLIVLHDETIDPDDSTASYDVLLAKVPPTLLRALESGKPD